MEKTVSLTNCSQRNTKESFSSLLEYPSIHEINQWTDPFISSEWIQREYKDRILQYTSSLPAELTANVFCYEFPLNKEEKWGDFSVQLTPPKCYLQKLRNNPISKISWQWETILSFLLKGTEQKIFSDEVFYLNEPLNKTFRISKSSLWLEFDVGSHKDLAPQPNLVLSLKNRKQNPLNFIEKIFYLIKGKELPSHYLKLLQQCKEKGSQIEALGFMLARPSDTLRFRISHPLLSKEDLSAYLHSINHPGWDIGFLELYEKLRAELDKLELYLEVGPQILPKIELICDLRKKKDFSILEKVINEKEQKELLLWRGIQIEPQYSHTMKGLFIHSKERKYLLLRKLGQIKLIYSPKAPLQVKAYLGGLIYPMDLT